MTNSSRKRQHCCCSTNSSIAAHRAAAAAAAAAPCMHIKRTSRLLRRHLNHDRTHFYTGTTKGGMPHKKKHHPGFEPRTPRSEGQQPTCYPTLFLAYIDRDWYISIRTNRRLGKIDQKTKTAPAAGRRREHTAEDAHRRVGRDLAR